MIKSIFKLGGGIAILILSIGCTPKGPGSFVSAIIGTDDRKDSKSAPIEESVGYLLYQVDASKNTKVKGLKGVHLKTMCTAFASAEREVTTASHCYDNPKVLMQPDESLIFVSTSGKKYPLNSHKLDRKQGLLVLTSRDKLKPLQIGTEFVKGLKTEIISYRNDKKKLAINGNAFSDKDSTHGTLLHSMDTVPGSSGSPILQNGKVIAVHLGTNTKTGQNYGALINEKVNLEGLVLLPESLFEEDAAFEARKAQKSFAESGEGREEVHGLNCGSKQGMILPCWKKWVDTDSNEGQESLPMYPYAKRENGCSIDFFGGRPGDFDNFASNAYNFSFKSACNKHDRCYYTLGTNEHECNANFTGDMQAVCTNGALQNLNKWDALTLGGARAVALAACEARVVNMASAVSALSFRYHRKAQKSQSEYLTLVQQYEDFFAGGKRYTPPSAVAPTEIKPIETKITEPVYKPEPQRDLPRATVLRVCNLNQQANNFFVAFGLYHPPSGRWASWGNHYIPSGTCTDIQLPYPYNGRLYPIGYDRVRKDMQFGDGSVSFCRAIDNDNGLQVVAGADTGYCDHLPNARRVVAGREMYAGPGTTQYTFY